MVAVQYGTIAIILLTYTTIMKLHLPIALLSAVVCSMTFVQADEITPKTEGTVSNGSGSYAYKTESGAVQATVSGDVTGLDFGGTGMTGVAANLPYEYKDSAGERAAASSTLNIGDGTTTTKVHTAVGAGVLGCYVSGNKTINIAENASAVQTVAGYYYWNYTGTKSDHYYDQIKNANASSDEKSKIVLNIYGDAGMVVGHYVSAQSVNDNPGWTAKEAIEINVKGGKTGTIYAGGYNSSVDNTVSVTVDSGTVSGSIYGGAQTWNAVTEAYVKGTHITINGGEIDGSITGGGSYQSNENGYYSEVKGDTLIEVNGGTINYNVHGGGEHDYIDGNTKIVLSGGEIKGNVYAAGRDWDAGTATNPPYEALVTGDSSIVISGEGTAVGGVLYGGKRNTENGSDSTGVNGNRVFEVDETHEGSQSYALADFKNIEVAGDLDLKSLEVAKDKDGTSVNVKQGGSISTKAGVLTDINKLNLEGTLNIDVSDAEAGKGAITGGDLSLDGATINVVATGAGASDSISVFAFDSSNENAGNFTLTMNGSAVDEELWGFENGVLFIKEASTTTLNLNRNQSRFHDALRAMQEDGNATPELSALATSRDADEVKAGLDALSGHEYATAMSSQIEGNMGHLRRLRGAMGKGTALGSYVVSPGSKGSVDEKGNEVMAATPAVTDVRNWRVGVSAFHEETEIDSDARGDGYDRSETGAMLTAEYYMNQDLTLGGALSYGRTNLRTDAAKRRHEDNTRFDVYALYGKKRWSFATSLGLGLHDHELERELADTKVDGYSVNFMQDAAYTVLSCDDSNVQVFGTVESSWNEIDSFSDGMISGASQDAWSTDVTVGLRYNHALPALGNAPAGVFTAQTGVTASIGDVKSGVDMSIGGYGYRQESATRNRWGWNLGAGVDVPVRSNISVYGGVDAVIRGDSSSVDGQIGVKVSF